MSDGQTQLLHTLLTLRQWQRIAISRAFMRADRPEVGLLLFDEPVSMVVSVSKPLNDHSSRRRR